MEAIINFLTSGAILTAFICVIAVSYLIIGLLTWSFIKPLKYLGVCSTIVGLVGFVLKLLLSYIVDILDIEGIGIVKSIILASGNVFLKYAVIFLVVGILLEVLYYVINKTLKSNKKKKDKDLDHSSSKVEVVQEIDEDIESSDEQDNEEDGDEISE